MVAVFGYSGRRTGGLHRICVERLAYAQTLSAGARAVVLSGWSEAEPMYAAWRGPNVELIIDGESRSTAQNAWNVAALARALDATELVAVTSDWHRLRVRLLLRRALRESGIRLSVHSPRGGRRRPLLAARELACAAFIPFQLRLAMVRAGRARSRTGPPSVRARASTPG
jgi:uncharacterized SAM-binding protein YcdF (DUF218 family)